MSEEWKQIEAVLDEKVRPSLRAHGGELEIDHLEDGVLYIKLLGQCAGCPSADLTNETLIEHELTAALPELVQKVVVVQTVSDELWEQAKRLLLQKIDRLPKDYGQIIVIHGYHAGNRLQTMVRKELKHTRLKRRILTMNAGETILVIE